MPDLTFEQLDELHRTPGAASAIERLIASLREAGEYRRLFDALLLKRRFEMGLPLAQPASLEVPEERRDEFEKAFVDAAREVGQLCLEAGNIPLAWGFLDMIREPQAVVEAIERYPASREYSEEQERVIEVALYQGAHPVKGLELLLRSHGTCNTVTAFNQAAGQMKPEQRRQAAALLVRELYADLRGTVETEVRSREPSLPEGQSLHDLIAGRDWLFGEGNYHIDTSHLHSVVGFARFLEPGDPELPRAVQLAEYGSRLDRRFQFAGEAPFDDFYAGHVHYLSALAGQDVDAAVAYFRGKLDAEPDEQDRPMLAYVLADLLTRIGRPGEAVEVAARDLSNVDEATGFSFPRLCQEAGQMDALRRASRENGDLVRYTAALVQGGARD